MDELQLYNATKSFGNRTILEEVSFVLKTGDIMGLFGSNGSGKSTLLKMLFGSIKSDSLLFKLNGKPLSPSNVIKSQSIGYLPQHPFLPSGLKIRDVIPIYHPSEAAQNKVFYNPTVAKIAHKQIGELSHGQRKFFEVILLGNLDHSFLLLDEPFSMLEPLQTQAIKEFLIELKQTKGLLITDHYYHDVLDITTHNVVLKDGKSFEVNGSEDLKKFEYLRTR